MMNQPTCPLSCHTVTPTDVDAVRDVHRGFLHAVHASTLGRFANFVYAKADPAEVRGAYEPDSYARLAELTATYDSANLLRFNHNIVPADQR